MWTKLVHVVRCLNLVNMIYPDGKLMFVCSSSHSTNYTNQYHRHNVGVMLWSIACNLLDRWGYILDIAGDMVVRSVQRLPISVLNIAPPKPFSRHTRRAVDPPAYGTVRLLII